VPSIPGMNFALNLKFRANGRCGRSPY